MPTTDSASAYEPRKIESIGTTWEKLLTRNGSRATLVVTNEHASNDGRFYLPSAEAFDDPWCLDVNGTGELLACYAVTDHQNFSTSTAGLIESRVLLNGTGVEKLIIGFGDNNADSYIKFGFGADEKLFAEAKLAGTVQWTVTADDATATSEWVKVMLVHDGIRPSLYVDGVLVSQTRSGDFQTYWFSKVTGLDRACVAALSANGSTGSNYNGKIDWLQIRDLTEGGKVSIAEFHFDDADKTATTASDHALTASPALSAFAPTGASFEEKSDGRILTADTTMDWSVDNTGDAAEISNTLWVKAASAIDVTVYETRRG